MEQIRAVVDAVHPKPVNVLMGSSGGPGLTALAQLGVRRVSVGGALSRAAWGGFMSAAQALVRQGNLDGLAPMPTHDDIDALFS
jgi:2-methylisocitrate lyase-like PEP mutase family enzyme